MFGMVFGKAITNKIDIFFIFNLLILSKICIIIVSLLTISIQLINKFDLVIFDVMKGHKFMS